MCLAVYKKFKKSQNDFAQDQFKTLQQKLPFLRYKTPNICTALYMFNIFQCWIIHTKCQSNYMIIRGESVLTSDVWEGGCDGGYHHTLL